MNRGPLDPVLQYVRRLVTPPAEREATDQQLLERFLTGHDQSAFSALVQRHGAMVLGVCRRLLENDQDCEDVFQATFLVLLRKASSIRN